MKRLKFKPQLTFSECLKLRVLKGISTVAVQPSDVMRASEVQTPSHPGSKSPPVLRSPCSSTMRPSICVPKGLILKHVGSATVEVRVDHDCKMIVQILTDVASQFGGDDLRRLRVEALNSKVHRVLGVEDANLRSLGCGFALAWFLLTEIGDGFCQFPKRVIQRSVEFRRCFHAGRFGKIWRDLALRIAVLCSGRAV